MAFILLAFWRGAAPERQAAFVFIGMFVTDRMYHWIFGTGLFFLRANSGHILIDAIALGAFVVIALRANRFYPLWLASFQLMTIASHIVRAINPRMLNGAYAVLAYAPSYLEVTVFAVGVVLHLRRQRKFGQYQSWQDS
jgi:hypothetical protein